MTPCPALIALWLFVVSLPRCDADGAPNATRLALLTEIESVLAGERRPRPLLLRLGRGLPPIEAAPRHSAIEADELPVLDYPITARRDLLL